MLYIMAALSKTYLRNVTLFKTLPTNVASYIATTPPYDPQYTADMTHRRRPQTMMQSKNATSMTNGTITTAHPGDNEHFWGRTVVI